MLTPLLAAPLAASLVALEHNRPYRVLFGVLALIGVLAMVALLLQPGDPNVEQAIFGNPSRNPNLWRWLTLRLGLDLGPVLPSIAPLRGS